jgi:hypothetical protein
MVPAHRRHDQPGERAGEPAVHRAAGPVQPGRGDQPGRRGQARRGGPPPQATGQAAGLPGEHAAQRLVRQEPDEPGAAGPQEVRPEPPLPGGLRQHLEAGHGQRAERHRGHRGLAEPAGEHQVRNEDQRHQLDAGRHADPGPLAPAPVRQAQIPDDQCHQQQFDLAEVQGALHRLGPQRDRGHRERPGQPAVAHPAQPAEGQPHGQAERGQAGGRHQPGQHAPRNPGPGGEDQRRERCIGELKARHHRPDVEHAGGVSHRAPGGHVDPQVEPGQHVAQGVRRHLRGVAGQGQGQHRAARQHGPPPRLPGRRDRARSGRAGDHGGGTVGPGAGEQQHASLLVALS